ncbi:hypothetical protein Cpir12675_003879 [Ceratocystis pirilliformis]|uniref:Uncharacterized protein n=1 Tax=Ceratocystis pirilliformis TaxID=259994 RepID=A0ABR3YZV1_9PEZI
MTIHYNIRSTRAPATALRLPPAPHFPPDSPIAHNQALIVLPSNFRPVHLLSRSICLYAAPPATPTPRLLSKWFTPHFLSRWTAGPLSKNAPCMLQIGAGGRAVCHACLRHMVERECKFESWYAETQLEKMRETEEDGWMWTYTYTYGLQATIRVLNAVEQGGLIASKVDYRESEPEW